MLTSSIDANFVIIITIIVRNLSLKSPSLSFKSSHTMEQKCPHTLSILKLFVHPPPPLVLNWKSEHLNDNIFTVYRSTFVKVVTYFHFFLFLFFFSFLRWCTINVMYSCMATSENAIQLRWIPFSLSINIIELCTLMYLFTFCISFRSVGVPRWAGCKIDTVLNCTVIDWKM